MRKALVVILLLLVFPMTAGAAPHEHVDSKERCAVCGMMVAKYPQWVSQLHVDEKVPPTWTGHLSQETYVRN